MIRRIRKRIYRVSDFFKEFAWITWLSIPLPNWLLPQQKRVPVVASLTSYPPRINQAWISIETLLRQTVRPSNVVLVLYHEDFPDKQLPRRLKRQVNRGLQILWVPRDGKSFDKLLPVRQLFPDQAIMTFDDDKFFPKNLVELLLRAGEKSPGAIIGARGWKITPSEGQDVIQYGIGWRRVEASEEGLDLFTPGGNGCLYPVGSLHEMVDSLDAALQICPTADDIWIWAAAVKNQTPFVCLGLPAHRTVSRQRRTAALSDLNEQGNIPQFQRALDYFDIRDLVVSRYA